MPVTPQLRINTNLNPIPADVETPGCSCTEWDSHVPLGGIRDHRWHVNPEGTWALNARALERSRARAAALGFRGRNWVAGHGGWSGSRVAEPPPSLARG